MFNISNSRAKKICNNIFSHTQKLSFLPYFFEIKLLLQIQKFQLVFIKKSIQWTVIKRHFLKQLTHIQFEAHFFQWFIVNLHSSPLQTKDSVQRNVKKMEQEVQKSELFWLDHFFSLSFLIVWPSIVWLMSERRLGLIDLTCIIRAIFVDFVFVGFFVVVVKSVLAHFQLKAASTVVIHDQSKCHSNDSEQSSDVRQHVVDFSETSGNLQPFVWFTNVKFAIRLWRGS